MLFPFKVELRCCIMLLTLWERFHLNRCLKHVSTHGNLIGRSVVCHWNYKWMSEMCIISFFRSCMFAECVLFCLLWKSVWFVFRLGIRKMSYLKFRRCPHYITGDDSNKICVRCLYGWEACKVSSWWCRQAGGCFGRAAPSICHISGYALGCYPC